MSGSKDNIYWDSCIFIAYLKNEIRQDPNDLAGINELFTLFDMGQLDIWTSTITIVEILETSITQEIYNKFQSFFSKRNFHPVDVTRRIAEISAEIRSHYYQAGLSTISTPDCIHIATAIYSKCGILYTFDGGGTRPGILTLTNPIAGHYPLRIQKPIPTKPPQLSFI
jgi:predicted nucleic acid-binding protein